MNMKRIKVNIQASIGIMLLLVMSLAACKKDKNEIPPVPFKITSYYPNSGNAGTLVTIEGEGFGTSIGEYSATISGKNAEVISATAKALVVRMPDGASSGNLSVKHGDKTYEVGQYTYQALSVAQVSPANGPAGSQIKITGTGFSSLKGPATVMVNGKPALVVSVSDTMIVAEVPADAGFGPIVVKVNGMESTGQNFTYQAIHSIKPLSGGKNTKVVIKGEGFETLAVGNVVDFNGKLATVIAASSSELTVTAPDGVSTGPLSVNINGQKTTGPTFTVVAPPAIEVVTPLSGPRGAEMIITGALFSTLLDENKVYINDVLVPITAASATQIKLVIPGGTGSGTVKVVVNDQPTNGPLFKDQNLGIQSVSPDNGLAGTTVTIKGSGFSTTAANNRVYFNGLLATVKTATENTLVLDAPVGLSTGDLKVVVGGEEALAPSPFRRAGVITLAGGPSSSTFGALMTGIAVDQNNNVYVTDPQNKVVKKIAPDGTVSILQSNGSNITFVNPFGIVIDKQNNIYVSDQGANHIRKITPSGQNTVYVSGFAPGKMAIDEAGNLYVNINGFAQGMNKVNVVGSYSKIGGPSWVASKPAVDKDGNLYFPDQNLNSNNGIVRITPTGAKIDSWVGYSEGGYADGIGSNAFFNGIGGGIAIYGNKIYVGDTFNFAIREVDIPTRTVSTVLKVGQGFTDGTLSTAKIGQTADIVVDKDGNIYILDAGNKAVRKIFLK